MCCDVRVTRDEGIGYKRQSRALIAKRPDESGYWIDGVAGVESSRGHEYNNRPVKGKTCLSGCHLR